MAAPKKETELDKAQKQFDDFEDNIKELTLDRANQAPKLETEATHKLSQKEIAEAKDIYLKPERSIASKEKFNEDYRDQYNYAKEYTRFIAENKEIIGESIEIWTKPFAGMPAEYWKVPVNKPVWGPKYLAEQIKRANYHRFSMHNSTVGGDHMGQYYGTMVVDNVVQRLDAQKATSSVPVYMGARHF